MKDKIIRFLKKLQSDNTKTTTGAVFMALLFVGVAILVYYFRRLIIIVVCGLVCLYLKGREKKSLQEELVRQKMSNIQASVVYIMQRVLRGLVQQFSLPQTENLGFLEIREIIGKNGVYGYSLYYLRIPNAPTLTKGTLEQLRLILNEEIGRTDADWLYDLGTFYVDIYVMKILAGDGKLRFDVVPRIDKNSSDLVDRHARYMHCQAIIGNLGDNNRNDAANRGELIDPETLPVVEDSTTNDDNSTSEKNVQANEESNKDE